MTTSTIIVVALFAFAVVGVGVAAYTYSGPFMAAVAALVVVGADWETLRRGDPDQEAWTWHGVRPGTLRRRTPGRP
jgi:hypothetical protein